MKYICIKESIYEQVKLYDIIELLYTKRGTPILFKTDGSVLVYGFQSNIDDVINMTNLIPLAEWREMRINEILED